MPGQGSAGRIIHTSRLGREALGSLALLLQINVPALRLARLVLEGEGKDGVALLNSILPVGVAGAEGRVDGIEGGRGGKLVCARRESACKARRGRGAVESQDMAHGPEACLPFLPLARVMVAGGGVARFHDGVIRGLAVERVEGEREVRYRLLRWPRE